MWQCVWGCGYGELRVAYPCAGGSPSHPCIRLHGDWAVEVLPGLRPLCACGVELVVPAGTMVAWWDGSGDPSLEEVEGVGNGERDGEELELEEGEVRYALGGTVMVCWEGTVWVVRGK